MKILQLTDLVWLSVQQASQITGMSPTKIRTAISENKLRAFRDGKIIRIKQDDLNEYLRKGMNF